MQTIYEAAEVLGATKVKLAKVLQISTSTLWRRQVRDCGRGGLSVDARDPYTIDFETGRTLKEEAEQVLIQHGINPQELRA